MESKCIEIRQEDGLFLSENFPGHFYELTSKLGTGSVGVVYAVLLKELKTRKPVKLLAAKVISKLHLQQKNEKRRLLNLMREIEILSIADSKTSASLIEGIENESSYILI